MSGVGVPLFRAAGAYAMGSPDQWQRPLARAFARAYDRPADSRLVRRCATGAEPLSAEWASALLALVEWRARKSPTSGARRYGEVLAARLRRAGAEPYRPPSERSKPICGPIAPDSPNPPTRGSAQPLGPSRGRRGPA